MSLIENILNRKKIKVVGKIISWVDSPEGHYPIISFHTVEGNEISGVLTRKEILSLEAMPLTASRKKELECNLPIEGIIVEYEQGRPYNFTGNYC